MRRQVVFVWVVMALFMAIPRVGVAGKSRLTVFVSIPPQKSFVERIGGERVDVRVLLSPGESPATYRPRPSLMAELAASDLFFPIGLPFETQLMGKIKGMANGLRVVETRKGVALLTMRGGHDERRGGHGSVTYEGKDPHVWLDPRRVAIQAITMRDSLIAMDPSGEKAYVTGCAELVRALTDLHLKISKTLTPLAGETLYVFHPAFGYFADAYGLVQKAVEVEGKRPKGRALSRFIAKARADKVRVIFVQPQFDHHAADKVAAAIGGAVVPLDPLAEDYFSNLGEMSDAVARALMLRDEERSGSGAP